MANFTDRLKRRLRGQTPDTTDGGEATDGEPRDQHIHGWGPWEPTITFWELRVENLEEGENRPFIERREREYSRCGEDGCDEVRQRNEKTIRQYLEIAEEVVVD